MYVFTWRHSTCPRYFASISIFIFCFPCFFIFAFVKWYLISNANRTYSDVPHLFVALECAQHFSREKKKKALRSRYILNESEPSSDSPHAKLQLHKSIAANFIFDGVGWVTFISHWRRKRLYSDIPRTTSGTSASNFGFVWRKIVITRVFFFQIGKFKFKVISWCWRNFDMKKFQFFSDTKIKYWTFSLSAMCNAACMNVLLLV